MNPIRRGALVALISCCFAAPAFAQERGTKEEAKAMVDAAIEHIKKAGPEKAYKDFTTDKATWAKKDLYVIVQDEKGVFLAHGANDKLVGKDLSSVKDSSGRPLGAGLLATANKGGGWYDYDWPDPLTKKIAQKSTFVRKLPQGEGYLGVGIYR